MLDNAQPGLDLFGKQYDIRVRAPAGACLLISERYKQNRPAPSIPHPRNPNENGSFLLLFPL